MLRTNRTLLNISPDHVSSRKRKRVNFDSEEKHEREPSKAATTKKSKFRRTADFTKLGSASAWDDFNLNLLNVDFRRTVHTPFPTAILEFAEHKITESESLKRRVSPGNGWLILGYERLLQDSRDVTDEDLRNTHEDQVQEKLSDNVLRFTLQKLGKFYVKTPRRVEDSTTMKEKASRAQEDIVVQLAAAVSAVSQGSDVTLPRYPATAPITPQKRIHSGNSMSTHTSPKRVIKAETEVQEMQNFLMSEIINCLYKRDSIPIEWARGRKISMDYISTNVTSFKCRLSENNENTDKFDRVKSISDGALCLVTDKPGTQSGRYHWSRQRAVLAFEAKRLDVDVSEMNSTDPATISDCNASDRAAQIYAEMLGLVCHPEYYRIGEQTPYIIHISGHEASIYWSRLPSIYLRHLHSHGIDTLSLTHPAKIPLFHTEPMNLTLSEQRTQFIRYLVGLIIYIADGRANIGFLRREPEGPIHQDWSERVEEGMGERVPQQVLDYGEDEGEMVEVVE